MRVDSVATDALTVVRGIGAGGTGIASVGSADTIVRMSNASISAARCPRSGWRRSSSTSTTARSRATRSRHEGHAGSQDVRRVVHGFREEAQKRREHLKALERTLFWGKRDLKTDSAVAGTAGYPQFFCGGLVSYISANITNLSGGTLSTTNLEPRSGRSSGTGRDAASRSALPSRSPRSRTSRCRSSPPRRG
jgi:hypothetical protein